MTLPGVALFYRGLVWAANVRVLFLS
jgi:hypothetical protein